jgi:hypothetical protein
VQVNYILLSKGKYVYTYITVTAVFEISHYTFSEYSPDRFE